MLINIKRTITIPLLLLCVLILVPTDGQVQSQRMPVEQQIKILKDKLKLSSEQTKKIKTILEDQREETTTAINDNRSDNQAMHAAVNEIAKKTDNKIKGILSEEQVKAYDKVLKDRQAQNDKLMKKNLK